MSNIVPVRPGAAATLYDAKSVALIRRTVAADTNDDEFELFIHMARALRLDPLRKQVYALVYSKNNPAKRRMSLITGIDGFRAIADRTGNYRPDDEEPAIEFDAAAKSHLNPAGIIKASVRVFKHSHGEWHKVAASAHWEEYAPIKDEWADDPETGKGKKTGRQTLDTSGNWGKMPRVMIAKVAEALALRKAWPDDFSNVYAEEEVDRSRALEMSAAELANEGAAKEREAKIGGPVIAIDWCDGKPLDGVQVGKFAERAMDFIKGADPVEAVAWGDRNRIGLREFWKHAPGDALEIKRALEAADKKAAVLTGEILIAG